MEAPNAYLSIIFVQSIDTVLLFRTTYTEDPQNDLLSITTLKTTWIATITAQIAPTIIKNRFSIIVYLLIMKWTFQVDPQNECYNRENESKSDKYQIIVTVSLRIAFENGWKKGLWKDIAIICRLLITAFFTTLVLDMGVGPVTIVFGAANLSNYTAIFAASWLMVPVEHFSHIGPWNTKRSSVYNCDWHVLLSGA